MKPFIFILLLLSAGIVRGDDLVIVDAADGSPVIGASVTGRSGIISGITDISGTVRGMSPADYPYTVHSLGYKNTIVSASADTLRLVADTYSLPEVVVKPGERPVIRTLSYVREYCTGASGSDTIQMFSEYMAETFVIDGKEKVKGYKSYDARPTVKNARRVARIVKAGTDSVSTPTDNEEFLSFFECISFIPTETFTESDSLRSGLVPADTVHGKYYPKRIMRRTDNLFIVQNDGLADKKGHKWSPMFFKLLGLTMEMQTVNASLAYAANDKGVYGRDDFIYGTYSSHILGKGKWIRKMLSVDKPIDMDCYVEMYPVSTTRLTVDEYKAQRDDWTRIPFEVSPLAQPLHSSVQRMIDRLGK
ncbi:MAG: carboxypeptidase-like regulatory domain-containing protein [Muribaculaceae bacterium]|nr:carboxypeptidase-like regulatory domain-containing protein [Muribaculaceae bacterium]